MGQTDRGKNSIIIVSTYLNSLDNVNKQLSPCLFFTVLNRAKKKLLKRKQEELTFVLVLAKLETLTEYEQIPLKR